MNHTHRYGKLSLVFSVALAACSGDDAVVSSGSGGTNSTGGHATGGMMATGGIVATGGIHGTGGIPATGGILATGGRPATGGILATGGMLATGGILGTGGRPDAGIPVDAFVPRDTSTPDTVTPTGGSTMPVLSKFVGNITTRGQVRTDFIKYWNQITPENEGKWGSVQGSNQSSFNWNSLDAIYKYTNDNNIIFKQHVFVWGAQQPSWVNNSNGEAAVKNWMKSFCARYPKVAIIDVVNEPPPHTTPVYADGIGGGTNSTWAWIANSFKWAREACPNAILVLNDYNNIEYANQRDHFIDIANKIKAAGAPIDGVGVQAHGLSGFSAATTKGHIDTIASKTGLPVHVTEFDIGIADDNQQKNKIQELFTMFYTHEKVKGITLWGYINGSTWVANTGLIQSNGTTFRPSMTWLMSYLGK